MNIKLRLFYHISWICFFVIVKISISWQILGRGRKRNFSNNDVWFLCVFYQLVYIFYLYIKINSTRKASFGIGEKFNTKIRDLSHDFFYFLCSGNIYTFSIA